MDGPTMTYSEREFTFSKKTTVLYSQSPYHSVVRAISQGIEFV